MQIKMDFSTLLKKKEVSNEIMTILKNPFYNKPSLDVAVKISKDYGVDLHPKYLFYWNELKAYELVLFLNFLKKIEFIFDDEDNLIGSEIINNEFKRKFEVLGVEHKLKVHNIGELVPENKINIIEFDELNTKSLLINLGIDYNYGKSELRNSFNNQIDLILDYANKNLNKSSVEIVNNTNGILGIRDKGGTYIGARMGRPEKAKMRKQFNKETRSHALFPVGEGIITTTKVLDSDDEKKELISNRTKNLVDAINSGYVEENFRLFYCEKCNKDLIYPKCPVCGGRTKQEYFEKYSGIKLPSENENSVYYKKIRIDLKDIDAELRRIIGKDTQYPKHVKGITDTINKHHTVEHISKGFLRALNNVYVNKDGTVRFDMIEMGITHFKPKEIGTSIHRLKELGYEKDYLGNDLVDENQIIEIFPQDVILPDCVMSGDELASDYIVNTGNYVDDLLEKLYGLPRYYNFKSKEDTIGHLIIGLAPHTSAGIVGRIIGYSQTQGCFSHPVWHAAQRRNLDGDENGIMLLLDGLINTSREYLPNRRGSRTMDVSLVLTSHLYLDQIDDEVHGMDIVDHYPLEFYRANKNYESPKSMKIIEKIDARLDIEDLDKRYMGYKFTHSTDNMNNTILCSSYKYLPSMKEKLDAQLKLAEIIRAVDEDVVGGLIIDKHFMKDIKGNLRKFGMQQFRCTKCNTSYRRPPLVGKCTHCGNPAINFTISEGSVKKYVGHSFNIIKKYNVDPYIAECVELVDLRIKGVFGEELEKQKNLNDFFK